MNPQFPKKGIHDNKPTPAAVYQIITQELGFKDVCLDRMANIVESHSQELCYFLLPLR